MNPESILSVAALLVLVASSAVAQTLFPANKAQGVNPDVQLKLTFSQPPVSAFPSTKVLRYYQIVRYADKVPLSETNSYAPAETHYLLDIPARCLGWFRYRPEFICGRRANAISRANAGD